MSWNKDVQKMYVSKPVTASEMSNAEYMQRFREAEERAKNGLNLTPGMRITKGDVTGNPQLEVISYVNGNYADGKMTGVRGLQLFKLDVGDGNQVELVVNGAYWAQKNENEHPTDETNDGEYYKLSKNQNNTLTSRQGVTKPHNEFYPFYINSNGKEKSIFLHSGLQSEGCFVTGGRLSRPDNNSIRFNKYVNKAIGNSSYIKTTHRIIDIRSKNLKRRYPLP
jgi:hypothetical protein